MGREVRRVPANWEHPKNDSGSYIPLHDGFNARAALWDSDAAKWNAGEFPEYASEENRRLTFEQWDGERPRAEDFMPDWQEAERTQPVALLERALELLDPERQLEEARRVDAATRKGLGL